MAEFVDVMKQWTRLCSVLNDKNKGLCHFNEYVCPLRDAGLCNKQISQQTDEDRENGERIIMAWTVDHPEPVYPTWYEYLISESVLVPRSNYTTYDLNALLLAQLKNTPIPADIAEKLGIEPKEG